MAEDSHRRTRYNRNKVIQNIIRSRTSNKLHEIEEYYGEIERKFHRDKKGISERYKEETKKANLTTEDMQNIAEYYSEEHYTIEDIFLKAFR